jgi:hypothetical protein
MPFIRGRYHINPVAGEALEAAREAEAPIANLEHDLRGDDEEQYSQSAAPKGPIHHVEIEAAELVPAHAGRAVRGFVAHVHRHASPASPMSSQQGGRASQAATAGPHHSRSACAKPETHAFTDHRDLVNFLRDELAKDAA